jgi:hypothetical protein
LWLCSSVLIYHLCRFHFIGRTHIHDTSNFFNVIYRGFNDAVNGFPDDGWSLMSSDGAEDVTIAINSSPNKLIGPHVNSSQLFTAIGGGILCAKASMLLQVYTLISSSFSYSYAHV